MMASEAPSVPLGDLVGRPDSRLSAAEVSSYLATGAWRPVRLDDYLWEAASARPEHPASIDRLGQGGRSMSYRELASLARRIAGGLSSLGAGRGDVVSVMLPNCSEFAASIFAISSLGAVYSGIPVAYGEKEAREMLAATGARLLILPGSRGRRDFPALAERLLLACPALEYVVLLDPAPGVQSEALVDFDSLAGSAERTMAAGIPRGTLAHIGFTSGTTSAPKGVLNSHETLDATLRGWVGHIGCDHVDESTVNLVASPIGHHAGFLWGVLTTAALGGTAVHLSRWDPPAAARTIRDAGVTVLLGAPAFHLDLMNLDEPAQTWDSIRLLAIAGAPVPRSLVGRAERHFDAAVCPAWGMTELGIGVSTRPADPPEKLASTDGRPVAGCEVRVVGSRGGEAAAGIEGDLQIRGPALFAGYLDQPAFITELQDRGGWFDTGDRALVDDEGYVTLRGRTKDLVIRGGENIPVAVVEDVLLGHPGVREVAIIGLPDARLGERACACVVTGPEQSLELSDLLAHLERSGTSKHFWPEELRVLPDLPRTVSGKVRKAELRERIAAEIDN